MFVVDGRIHTTLASANQAQARRGAAKIALMGNLSARYNRSRQNPDKQDDGMGLGDIVVVTAPEHPLHGVAGKIDANRLWKAKYGNRNRWLVDFTISDYRTIDTLFETDLKVIQKNHLCEKSGCTNFREFDEPLCRKHSNVRDADEDYKHWFNEEDEDDEDYGNHYNRLNPATTSESQELTEELTDARRDAYKAALGQVERGIHPIDAVAEMYESEPAWRAMGESLDEVTHNLVGDVIYDRERLLSTGEQSLRAIWKARKEYELGLSHSVKEIARGVERDWKAEDEDEGDEEEGGYDEYGNDDEDDASPYTAPTSPRRSALDVVPQVGKFKYNLWVFRGGTTLEPLLDQSNIQLGSDSTQTAESMLEKGQDRESKPLMVLPQVVNTAPYNIWERRPETGVWTPVIYKRKKEGGASHQGDLIHLGHHDLKMVEQMVQRLTKKYGVETVIVDDTGWIVGSRVEGSYIADEEIPVKAYSIRGVPWKNRRYYS